MLFIECKKTNRQLIIKNAAEKRDIDLLGDKRWDSPGYNAKYGTYAVLDNNSGLILDFNVSHISYLTTDRHKEVRCYMRKDKGK